MGLYGNRQARMKSFIWNPVYVKAYALGTMCLRQTRRSSKLWRNGKGGTKISLNETCKLIALILRHKPEVI